jgi:hypothetical protein
MQLRPKPPEIPSELLDKFGEPEHVFGPNMPFRIKSAVVGACVLILGFGFLLYGMMAKLAGVPGAWDYSLVYMLLGGGLMTVGAAAIILPWRVPLKWLFSCPQGLVRTSGDNWDAVEWADVARFQELDVSGRAVTIRQCRIITTSGTEWGFLADYVADYDRLKEVLRTKVVER